MDIVGGLSAASLALGLVKDLRDIDRSVDEATFKLKVAELTSALADTKISLSDAKLSMSDKDEQIRSLEAKIKDLVAGEMCPVCNNARLKTISVRPHPTFGKLGVQEKQMKCEDSECNHSENRMHDPQGRLKK
ncbi:MAG: hypothetical protein L3J37_03085 [Rhodobacteraceae bacterium]|nr:hypothetical protein [Paracoccaceae bacterium]